MDVNEKEYEIIEKNGITMLSIRAINQTGIAEAYCSVRSSDGGASKGYAGKFSTNVYKKLGLEEGILDFQRFCMALGVDSRTVITNRLTAGTNTVRVVSFNSLDKYNIFDELNAPRADGLVTDSPEVTLFNYAADCAIVHFLDPINKAIGSCHAGWAGSLNGIMKNTLSAMSEHYGSNLRDIIAVICPSICECCFEVGDEVSRQFKEAGYGSFVSFGYGKKPHVDLFGVNRAILMKAGLLDFNIHSIDICTYCHPELFHSFRRGPIDDDGMHLNGMNGMFIKLM